MTSYRRDYTSKRVDGKTLLSVWDLTAERPIRFREAPDRPHGAAPPLVGSVDGRVGVQGNNRAAGSEAGWSTYRSNEALCQTSGLRDREVLFTLLLDFQRSLQLSPVVFDWFCVCTADHTSVIFTIIIEIYSRCFSAVIATRSESGLHLKCGGPIRAQV